MFVDPPGAGNRLLFCDSLLRGFSLKTSLLTLPGRNICK
jgi:hypothetical protein